MFPFLHGSEQTLFAGMGHFAFFALLCHSEPRCRPIKRYTEDAHLHALHPLCSLQCRSSPEVTYGPYHRLL